MTVQFSRSVRSIQADNLRPILIGVAFFAVLMVGWLLWFFFATIPNYETSTNATYRQQGYVVADFPATAFSHLQRGQSAQFMPVTAGSTAPFIALVATDLYPESGQVRFVLRGEEETSFLLVPGLSGQVRVTVERLSPARIVLRAAGLLPQL